MAGGGSWAGHWRLRIWEKEYSDAVAVALMESLGQPTSGADERLPSFKVTIQGHDLGSSITLSFKVAPQRISTVTR